MVIKNVVAKLPDVHVLPCPNCGENGELVIYRTNYKDGVLCRAACTKCKASGHMKLAKNNTIADYAALVGWNEAFERVSIPDYKRGSGKVKNG